MKQFKLGILGIVILAVIAVVWTALRPGPAADPQASGATPIATAPPIQSGQKATHPNWGACTNCHKILGAKPVAFTGVATAPPIHTGQPAPHADWGACTNCHEMIPTTGAAAKVAITTVASVAPPLGIWIRPVTPALADRMKLENTDGVIISGVLSPSPAADAGLQTGDLIQRLDNIKLESVQDALGHIANTAPNQVIKLMILRDGRSRKVFVTIWDGANRPTGKPQLAAAAGPATAIPERIAIAATSGDLAAQVAPSFGQAPAFILFETSTARFFALPNPGAATLTAGQQAIDLLGANGVGAVITGNIGPGSLTRLQGAGIQVYSGAFGAVTEVARRYQQGSLVPAGATALGGAAQAPAAQALAGAAPSLGGKVIVAADGPSLASGVAADLGMAPYLILYDPATGVVEAIAKDPAPDQGTASVQTAQLVVERGGSAVVAGNIAPGTVQQLGRLGVFAFAGVSGTVGQALQLYRNGALQATTATAIAPAGLAPGQGVTL